MTDEPMLTVSASTGRKVTDGDFGSFDKNYHISIREQLPPGEMVPGRVAEILDQIDDALEERIAVRMREWMKSDTYVQERLKQPKTPETKPGAPTQAPSPPLEGNMQRMSVTAIRVKNHPDKPMRIVFALGVADSSLAYRGNWKKFGVVAYPETYKAFFDPEAYGLGDHQPGAKLFADVIMKDDGITPEKVYQFRNQHNVAYPRMEEEE